MNLDELLSCKPPPIKKQPRAEGKQNANRMQTEFKDNIPAPPLPTELGHGPQHQEYQEAESERIVHGRSTTRLGIPARGKAFCTYDK